MLKCEVCGELVDRNFTCQYERDETKGKPTNHNVIYVCDNCDHPEWDEENNEYYLIVDGIRWFN